MPEEKFVLTVPVDASELQDVPKEDGAQEVRVLARAKDGTTRSTTVKLAAGKKAKATLEFESHPGTVRVVVGPADASDDELLGLQTLITDVSVRMWEDEPKLTIPPIVVTPHWWWWWLRWCRVFTVRGRVICPDGSPVPGAEVCAFDVDRWFLWSSRQQVGCVTTGIDGTFELTFRWCCGWWPWWWWRHRVWRLDDFLQERVGRVLRARPDISLGRVGLRPSLDVFERLVEDQGPSLGTELRPSDVTRLPQLRERLVRRLPSAPELENLRLWPWHPWTPWRDCTPDLVFRVTQDCEELGKVVLDETLADTRWNVDTETTVTLVVEDACCVPCPEGPCEELECLVLDRVCGTPVSSIGGNAGADPTPVGYANPGVVPDNSTSHHKAFAGLIPIWTNPNDVADVDYFELELFDDSVMDWGPLPAGAASDFHRRYWDFGSLQSLPALFNFQFVAGHEVIQSRRHFEDGHPSTWPGEPGPTDALWLSTNYSLLARLDTTQFTDGTYRFRVVGWEADGPTGLKNRRVLPVCGSEEPNELVLTFDNRVENPSVHDWSHFCGAGVHICTDEPDTHITGVRIEGKPATVLPCATMEWDASAWVLIDFEVTDPDGHLSHYALHASWGLNQTKNLLTLSDAEITTSSPGASTGFVKMRGQTSANYGTAVNHESAVAPHWYGGSYTLRVPLATAFPDMCCYQIELVAFKRTLVGTGSSCYHGPHVSVNGNRTEYSIGVGVCPPEEEERGPPDVTEVPVTRPVVPDIRDVRGGLLRRPPTSIDPLGRGGR